jgi:protein involved in polysaccharide export with SLBB domain
MVYGEKEAETYVFIEKDGRISPKLVEPIKVVGLTIAEARKALIEAYSAKLKVEYLRAWIMVYPLCGRKN